MATAPQATKKDDSSLLLPLGALGLILFLAVQFVRDDNTANTVQFFISIAFGGVVLWGHWLTEQGRGKELQRTRDRILVVLGLGGALAYPNFGHLHFGNFLHIWDTYHYYMGSKYAPELGYDLLYDCSIVADLEKGASDPQFRVIAENAKKRIITDLRTNVMVHTDKLVEDPTICTSHFTPARWESFKRDIDFFRGRVSDQRWKEIHHDHGYNATPVWTLMGWLLTNTGPATLEQVTSLNLIDPLYIALAAALIYWAFGPRVFALSMLMLGCNFPNRYYWTGGAFLRHDWLFYTVAVVCLLKKEKFFLAGLSLAYCTLLRLFPGLLVVGPLLAGVEYVRLHKKLDPRFLRFVAGGALGCALLIPASFAIGEGAQTWVRFAQNTTKHANTPLTNHMGLRSVLGYRPSTVGRNMRDGSQIDAWQGWKNTRLEKFRDLKLEFIAILLGAAALIYLAIRHTGVEYWMAAAMGCGYIVFGAELTCYYYCFLMGVACLYEKRREVAVLLCAMAAMTEFIHLGPIPGMSGWEDEQYVGMSVAALLAMGGIWWLFTRWGSQGALPQESEPEIFEGLALAGGGTVSASAVPEERKRDRKKKKR